MSSMKGRLFLAVPLTGEARSELSAHLEDNVPARSLPGRNVPSANWHFTLRFLGDASVEAYEALVATLQDVDLGQPFELEFATLGAFPKPARARVIWIGTTAGARELAALAALAEAAAVAAGFESERRPFRPHLTISRVRPDQDVRSLVDAVPAAGVKCPVREVLVFRSHLSPDGARYEVLDRLPLVDD